MTKQCCDTCVYSYCSSYMRYSGMLSGYGVRPLCMNHPDVPGQLVEVRPYGICRNYRPRPPAPAQPQDSIRRIPLAGGHFVLVDAADFEWLNRYTWSAHGAGYAVRHEKGKTIFMHREIMNAPKGMVVDHADGNKRNNCRCNLRVCTHSENNHNKAKRIGSSSRFKGVSYSKDRDKWLAGLSFHGERLVLGTFDDEIEAAHRYDRKAVELFGEFAWLNFPEEWPPEKRQQVYADAQPLREALKAKAGKPKTPKGKSKKAEGKSTAARAGTRGRREPKRTAKVGGSGGKEGRRQPAPRDG